MGSEAREWSIPAPIRALLWWPAIAFVLVVVAPDAGVGSIVVAGAVLAVLGVLVSVAAARWRSGRAAGVTSTAEQLVETTVEFPTAELPRITDERAA